MWRGEAAGEKKGRKSRWASVCTLSGETGGKREKQRAPRIWGRSKNAQKREQTVHEAMMEGWCKRADNAKKVKSRNIGKKTMSECGGKTSEI